jgi:hypothetical protein
MLELVIALLAGVLIIDVAIQVAGMVDRNRRRRRDEASRARIRSELNHPSRRQ